MLTILSYSIAKMQHETPLKIIGELVALALAAIFITHFIGDWITEVFG